VKKSYQDLIAEKHTAFEPAGMKSVPALSSKLMPHQEHCVDFALRAGRSALFLDTGLGKTFSALEWSRIVFESTNKPVLMLAPLAVSGQHQREAERFGIDAVAIREPSEITGARTYITNYERLERFDPSEFGGVILDESSILKSFTGVTTRSLIEAFKDTPYRLACTATPAPNDNMELGQHSSFLGVMRSSEMLARWFLADQANMGKYRIKAAAVNPFWEWVASWARCISLPSDLGFSDDGYILPEIKFEKHIIRADTSVDVGGERDGQIRLFRTPDMSATSIHKEKRLTVRARAELIAGLVASEPNEPWGVWCDTDYEADELAALIPEAVEVRGSMSPDTKERNLVAFSEGQSRVIITKPSVAGYGLNWQHCARVAFVGLSFSYESFYQAIRRCHRFGQSRQVHVHVACADTEESIWSVVSRKSADHNAMKTAMTAAMKRVAASSGILETYDPRVPVTHPEFLKVWK